MNNYNELESKKTEKEAALRRWLEEKIQLAKKYIEEEDEQKGRKIVQGAVHICELGENIGSEKNELRPVVILSNNRINSSSGNVIVAPLSKRVKTKQVKGKEVPRYLSHYILKQDKYPFLSYTSAVQTEDIVTVSKIRLKDHLGYIDSEDLKRIKTRVKWTFDL